jgi:amino acid adenylation domain-containing protein
MFTRALRQWPDHVAVQDGTTVLTYAELERRSAGLAASLRSHGVTAGSVVGLQARPSADLITALLAILRAGAAFVGIDPGMPAGRAAFMLARSGAGLLVTDHSGSAPPPWDGPTADICDMARLPGYRAPRPAVPVRGLAYALFTSGSTGRPKGVAVPHAALANYAAWAAAAYRLRPAERSIVHGSIGFDLMLTSIFPALHAGQALVMTGHGQGLASLAAELQRGPAGLLKLTPSHLRALNALLASPPEVRALVVGGEQLFYQDVRGWFRASKGTRVFNEYGPTEATIGCCAHQVSRDVPGNSPVPIGKPAANVDMFLLGEDLRPVAPGQVGEIYIGGSCLAAGYLGEPSLTAGRFVPDAVTGRPGARLYRTGDLGRVLESGDFAFAGRADDQVKVRGFRVEPGDTAAVLTAHPACREAVVAKGPGDRLMAFLVPAGKPVNARELRRFAAGRLPSYLVPDLIVWVDRIPVTLNGKADSAALLSEFSTERTSRAWRI